MQPFFFFYAELQSLHLNGYKQLKCWKKEERKEKKKTKKEERVAKM